MLFAMDDAGINNIDAIITHAPGTIHGDAAELNAIYRVFGDVHPIILSNKWMIGHTFGASAALSVELGIHILHNQEYSDFPYPVRVSFEKKEIKNIDFIVGDAEILPFDDESFDIITIAYGFRNISDQPKALKEFNRVLKSGGRLLILEFSNPRSKLIKFLYRLYSVKIMPKIASLFTEKYAYEYLPESIEMFPKRSEVKNQLKNSQFSNTKIIDMTFGISSIFITQKNESK